MFKKTLLAMFTAVMFVAPVCHASDWVYMADYNDCKFYIDMDSAWFDGVHGGFLSKVVNKKGYASIFTDSFQENTDNTIEYGDGEAKLYNPAGDEIGSTLINVRKVYTPQKNAYQWCKMVEYWVQNKQ